MVIHELILKCQDIKRAFTGKKAFLVKTWIFVLGRAWSGLVAPSFALNLKECCFLFVRVMLSFNNLYFWLFCISSSWHWPVLCLALTLCSSSWLQKKRWNQGDKGQTFNKLNVVLRSGLGGSDPILGAIRIKRNTCMFVWGLAWPGLTPSLALNFPWASLFSSPNLPSNVWSESVKQKDWSCVQTTTANSILLRMMMMMARFACMLVLGLAWSDLEAPSFALNLFHTIWIVFVISFFLNQRF